jgi:lipoprotein-releasing system permease protein
MLFSLTVGYRYFRSGGSQTVLTVVSVGFGVTVYLFITSLIFGLQNGLIKTTIGNSSHITVQAMDEEARVLPTAGKENLSSVQPFNERDVSLKGYRGLVSKLERIQGVTAVSSVASGPGFAIRGGQSRPITLIGIEEDRGSQIFDLRTAMRTGRLDLGGQGAAIGIELARLLGVKVGDKVSVLSAKNVEQVFRINGTFDSGNKTVNERSFYISLSSGQRLNDIIGSVSRLELKVGDPFGVDPIASVIQRETGLKVETWKQVNAELLSGLAAQSQTTSIIRLFVMILVATGVASVLIVSVLQRSREIGILKSMGVSTQRLQGIFIVLGSLVGLSGALVGVGLGGSLVLLAGQIPGNSGFRPGYALPIDMQFRFVLESFMVAAGIGSIAAILPARRAALMNPVDVIRLG